MTKKNKMREPFPTNKNFMKVKINTGEKETKGENLNRIKDSNIYIYKKKIRWCSLSEKKNFNSNKILAESLGH